MLARAQLSIKRTDHRGVARAGQVVTGIHYGVDAPDAPIELDAPLSSLADALAV